MTANPKRESFGQNTEHGLSAETARLLGLSLLQKGDWDRAAGPDGSTRRHRHIPVHAGHAAAKRCYDTLFEGDLLEFLLHSGARYQAIASAGTLIHFGDLLPVLKAVRNALAENALFVCSLYSYDPTAPGGFGLAHHPSLADAGCFAHGSEYVKIAAERAGLQLLSCLPVTHEENADENIPGLLVTAKAFSG